MEDVVADLTEVQLENIRRRVRAGIQEIEKGSFETFEGAGGLSKLTDRVKHKGRKLLEQRRSE